MEPHSHTSTCDVFEALDASSLSHTIGFSDGHLISDVIAFRRRQDLFGPEERYIWRSGIKHDCSKVMEFRRTEDGYVNGLGEQVLIEDDFLYPMLKSSDVANGRNRFRALMLVTQQFVGDDTSQIEVKAPKTWEYLNRHSALLDRRESTIYRNKSRFAIFGVGPYSFAPWKIAISGFYKKLSFVRVGPLDGRPVVLDDTVYFLPCQSEAEASFLESLLQSDAAEEFYRSMIHWNDKRPITADVLKRLSIQKLAIALSRDQEYQSFVKRNGTLRSKTKNKNLI